jgi:hypothetical protein
MPLRRKASEIITMPLRRKASEDRDHYYDPPSQSVRRRDHYYAPPSQSVRDHYYDPPSQSAQRQSTKDRDKHCGNVIHSSVMYYIPTVLIPVFCALSSETLTECVSFNKKFSSVMYYIPTVLIPVFCTLSLGALRRRVIVMISDALRRRGIVMISVLPTLCDGGS